MPVTMGTAAASNPAARRGGRVCQVCGGELDIRDVLDPVCQRTECRQRFFLDRHQRELRLKEKAQREKAARHRAMAENTARRLLEFWTVGEEAPGERPPPIAIIPTFDRRLTNLPERRRRAFRDHLMRIVSQAASAGEIASELSDDDTAAPEHRPWLARMCGFCEGWCCPNGGNHAYLSAETLRRYMDAHPDRRPRDVFADYYNRLGNRIYDGSCVYHGPAGCRLPREMRSDTCNRYYCGGLIRFQRQAGVQAPTRAVVISQRQGVVRYAAYLSGERTRLVHLPMVPVEDDGTVSRLAIDY